MNVAFTVAAATLCAPVMQAMPAEVGLTVASDQPFARVGEPVTCGVPLVRGFVGGPEELTLLGPADQPVPVQIEVTSTFHDGTPRWVLLRFAADVPAGGRAVYRLTRGQPAALLRPLTCELSDGVARIDTGAARFTIDTRRFRLFDTVEVGGEHMVALGGGAFLDPAGGTGAVRAEDVTSAEFEQSGPLAAVLCVRGAICPAAPLPLADYACRFEFRAGSSEARVTYTLHNPAAHAHPGNTWDLGTGGSVFIEDFSMVLPLPDGEWSSRLGVGGGVPPITATKLYQDSSGGPNWNSVNHVDKDMHVPVTFRGYRVSEGDEVIGEGERAEGWLHARREGAGGIAVSVRDFWHNCPKVLERPGGNIRIGLWPREFAGTHELLGGEQKTHEVLFVFHGAEVTDQAVEHRMEAFQHPLYAMPDPEAVLATRAFAPTAPLDRERFAALERTCDAFVEPATAGESVFTKWDQIDEYGWRHFGDTFADNEASPAGMVRDFPEHHFGSQPISHFGNEYDVTYAIMLQGLRRQNPRWMWLADVMARHYADICIYHTGADGAAAYAHAPFSHTTHDTAAFRSTHRMFPSEADRYGLQYASGGPNAGHCYVASLAQHFYLTGDRVSRDAFLEVAGWSVHSPWFTEMMMGDQRGIGDLLMTHVYAYAMTGEREFYDAAMTMIRYVKEPFSGLGGTLFAKAAGRFLDLKRENGEEDADYEMARETLMRFGDLYLALPDDEPSRWIEQACFYSEVLALCYLHAPEDHPNRHRFLARAEAMMDATEGRWPGAYVPTKTFVMCFGSTGAYQRAVTEQTGTGIGGM